MVDKPTADPQSEIPDSFVAIARAAGPVRAGQFRVVVIESDGHERTTDFSQLNEALAYADDVASESDVPWPLAYVFDDKLAFIRRGRHYAAG